MNPSSTEPSQSGSPLSSNITTPAPGNLAPPHNNPLAVRTTQAQDARRPSIQFAASTHLAGSEAPLRAESPASSTGRPTLSKRKSSPPPPTPYESRVSFDTFDNRDATDFSFTLRSKHRHYNYTKRSRTFLCGTDQNDYSEFALEWLLDELVDDGDEVVCLRVVDKDSKITSDASVEEGRYKSEANALLEHIKAKNKDGEKSISLVLEFAVGKVQDTIQRMIAIYEPACLIVGTRGRSLGGLQGLLPGSVSKYCLQSSPVPVIVVRPSAKREKKRRKRLADPSRRSYMDILDRSSASGSQILDKAERDKLVDINNNSNVVGGGGGINIPAAGGTGTTEATEQEARAVARAIGLPSPGPAALEALKREVESSSSVDEGSNAGPGSGPGQGTESLSPLTKTTSSISARSEYTSGSGPDSPSPEGGLSPDDTFASVMASPEPEEGLDSPVLSEDEEEEEEGDDDQEEGEGGDDRGQGRRG
ncbi:hypothetical protein MMC09_004429 [Bachmanniomyces sp. S44760]|nr:hypothetical protein [Bachmanniomyces sp. S44760]